MSTTISKAKPTRKSMDYHFLREEGIRHIQKLAGSLWTDYNSHDPGMTLLEILCYAITDLGYRTSLPVQDLLADSQARSNGKDFHGITDILPCSPVTITDLRKVIIDHEGIRNAWVEKNETTSFSGLYDIMLELEEDEDLGELNFILLESSVIVGPDEYAFEVTFSIPDELLEIESGEPVGAVAFNVDEDGNDIFIRITEDKTNAERFNDYYTGLNLSFDSGQLLTIDAWIKVTSEVSDAVLDGGGLNSLSQEIKNELTDISQGSLIYHYWERVQAAALQVSEVQQLVHDHRPLCEDFQSFKTFKAQEIGIQADIDLSPDANAEEVLAEIYYRIHAFLSPRPHFHTLEEMLAGGKHIEDIFEGPLLRHGFLDIEELETLSHRDVLYTSDLQQLLTDIPGLIAVRDFRISNYFRNEPVVKNTANCLKLLDKKQYKPLLSPGKSQVNFYKDRFPVTMDKNDAREHFEGLKSDARQEKKIAVYELPPPRGEDREAGHYFSIQHHFPLTYGVGSEQLPASASDLRKAQARQLKGYLLFFEQLLANYFSQLANIKTLFSMEHSVDSTYFSQSLTGLVTEASNLLSGDYETNLPDITEPLDAEGEPRPFQERRNRFLNHLMARFCEGFGDYALFLYSMTAEDEGAAFENLLEDKVVFLLEYPTLGHDRNKAYNSLNTDVWGTANVSVSGLKKRIARLLGLESYERDYIFNGNSISHYFTVLSALQDDGSTDYSFELNNAQLHLISSTTNYPDEDEARTAAGEVAVWGTQKNHYTIINNDGGTEDFSFQLLDDQGNLVAETDRTGSEEEIRVYIQEIINFLSIEGNFHLLEHLHLRIEPEDGLENPIILPDEEDITDPYSFRISFILPMQHRKLGNPDFRTYAEKVIRSETPAHIIPHIYWVDIGQMNDFEEDYRIWLEAYVNDTGTLEDARNNLVESLNDLVEDS